MTIPALLLGILVSTMMGAALHLVFGGSLGRLVVYVLIGWAGFWGGHFGALGHYVSERPSWEAQFFYLLDTG